MNAKYSKSYKMLNNNQFSNFTKVEQVFADKVERRYPVNLPYLVVENFPKLGLLTALRFLEWVSENPDGVISLPTGKTPEHFIFGPNIFLKIGIVHK